MTFDSGALPVTKKDEWQELYTISRAGQFMMTFTVGGGGDIADLKFTAPKSYEDFTHVDMQLQPGGGNLRRHAPDTISIAAGQSLSLIVAWEQQELSIWAKKAAADTTLRIQGTTGPDVVNPFPDDPL